MAYAPIPMPRSARPGGYPSTKNPFEQFFGSKNGANALIGLGTGLLRGRNFSEGLSYGGEGYMQGAQTDDAYATAQKAEAERMAKLNSTVQMLQERHPDLAEMVQNGMSLDKAYETALKRSEPGKATDPADSSTGRQRFAAEYGLSGDEATRFVLTGELPGGNQGVRAGMGQPIPVRNSKTGQTGAAMPMSDGTYLNPFTQQPFDQDWEFDPAWVAAQRAQGAQLGKEVGAAQFDLPAAELSMRQSLDAIDAIRSESKGMEEQFGMGGLQQMTPAWPGSDKAKFQVAVERGVNRAFLEAREVLRGGGQITDFESKKAETAITNMQIAMEKGDKEQFQAALAEFEQAVKDGYSKLVTQAGQLPTVGGGAQQPGGDLKTKYGLE